MREEDQEKTIASMRIKRSNLELIRGILQIIAILGSFLLIMAVFGFLQYRLCLARDPEMEISQCFQAVKR